MKSFIFSLILVSSISGIGFSQSIDSQICEFASREYPNDSRMQQYFYYKQNYAIRYILTVKDVDIEQIANREYPDDYVMQKYTYDNQVTAKRYISVVTDREVKQIALREYPGDYSMQMYKYNRVMNSRY